MDKGYFSQVAAVFGALIFSATCIGATVAPARAVETVPVVAQAAPGSADQVNA